MSGAGSERRRHPRYEVSGLRGSLVVPIEIRVINLSLGGMALETHSYLQFGRAYNLRLEGAGRSLALSGTVAWCSLKGTRKSEHGEVLPVYRAGLRFEELGGERSRELWELIRGHVVVDVEDSVLGRFKVDLPRDPALNSSYDFTVRKLSLSGMLIETDFVPEVGSRFDLQLRLGGRPWQTRARVASVPRSGRLGAGELAEIGLEFCDLQPDEQRQLSEFIGANLRQSTTS